MPSINDRSFPLEVLNGATRSRRDFLGLIAAAMAVATGCRRAPEAIMPATRRDPRHHPGEPVEYATAVERNGFGLGLIVTCHDGWPVKVEGNPLHPISQGATDAITQACLWELYDPDRSRRPMRREGQSRVEGSWADFETFTARHFAALRRRAGDGLCVLGEPSLSPSLEGMRGRFLEAFPNAQWYTWSPVNDEHELAGTSILFGEALRPFYDLTQADVVLSLDADLLGQHPASLKHARDFARRRRGDGSDLNRLYIAESTFSITGSVSDHRLAIRSSDVTGFAKALVTELGRQGSALPADLMRACERDGSGNTSWGDGDILGLARDLMAHRGRCMMAAGVRQPPIVHALVHMLNFALGARGNSVRYLESGESTGMIDGLRELTDRINAGSVDTLLLLGGNPVYDAPADLAFGDALSHAGTTIHLSAYNDITSRACTWHAPCAHQLETWGDVRACDGTVSISQPMLEPLWGGQSAIELLAMITQDDLRTGYELVGRTFQESFTGGMPFARAWHESVQTGVVANTRWPEVEPNVREIDWPGLMLGAPGPSNDNQAIEAVFIADHKVFDGRHANNALLQELPDPLTKLTWSNAAVIGPATARSTGVDTGDVLRIEHDGRSLELPVCVLPGHAERSVTLPLGYGRRAAGRVGNRRGVDVYPLRTTTALDVIEGVRVTATGQHRRLASTQTHHDLLTRREHAEAQRRVANLVREWDITADERMPDSDPPGSERVPKHQSRREYQGDNHQWGMAVDLAACIGCNACVIACQVENNIPVVGEAEVHRGREMHWLRIDRCIIDSADSVRIAHLPVACMHCEEAPCETVCPVAATVHTAEGLNDQNYARCIGVRYCENNCPYKVRRFNWFDHQGDLENVEAQRHNPDVSVRSRGVMEKCTYCVQRIERARLLSKVEDEPLTDGTIAPACAQVCPTRAIVFGDLNDPASQVRRLHDSNRAYSLLGELGTKPRTMYLARYRNPMREPHAKTDPAQ